jgi:hypothetical protein
VAIETCRRRFPSDVGGGAAQQAAEKARKILSVRVITPSTLPVGNIQGRNQHLSAVAAVLELTPLDLARRHRQSRRDALERMRMGSASRSSASRCSVKNGDRVGGQ